MITYLLLLCWSQSYQLPMQLEHPRAYWGDWDGDARDEIWVKDRNGEHWIIDQDSDPVHLESDQSPQRVFPLFWESTWYAATLLHDRLCIYRNENWTPVLHRPGLRFRPGGRVQIQSPFLIIPTLSGFELLRDGCLQGALPIKPTLNLGVTSFEVQFPEIRLKSINRNGFYDFHSTPLINVARGSLQINTYVGQGDFWVMIQSEMNFPPMKQIQKWAVGLLDPDAYPDLVLLVAQPQGGSIFEEMELIIYKGEGPGKWGNLPLQTIKTRQNIWQEGPIDISRQGIRLFYYKGLVRSLFRVDFYPLMDSEVVQPEPESHGWKMKDADRNTILTHLDLNGDGIRDLLLSDDRGLMFYPGDSTMHFSDKKGYSVGQLEQQRSVVITLGGAGADVSFSQSGSGIRGNGKLTMLVCRDGVQFWSLERDMMGMWVLSRKKEDWIRK